MIKIAVFTNKDKLQDFFFIKRYDLKNKIKDPFIEHLDILNKNNILIDVFDYERISFQNEMIYEKINIGNIKYNIAYLYQCDNNDIVNKLILELNKRNIFSINFQKTEKSQKLKENDIFKYLEDLFQILKISEN